MTRFASKNAARHGRRGRHRSYQHAEAQYADFVLRNQSAAERATHHIRQDRQLVALHIVRLVNQMHEGGR